MSETPRFVAFDVHKSYVLVAALDATLQIVLPPRRVRMDDLPAWARQALRPTDRVVLEATSNAWTLYDLLAPLVAEVQVAHPLLVKLISSARVKTDTRDTLHLARLLAANLIPTVWVPPPPVRELRALVAHRERLVRQRTGGQEQEARVCSRATIWCLQSTKQSGSNCRSLRWIASASSKIGSWWTSSAS